MSSKANTYPVESIHKTALEFLKASRRCAEIRQLPDGKVELLLTPMIVNLSFSMELIIKALLVQNGIAIEREHHIRRLFDGLPDKVKAIVIKKTGASSEELYRYIDAVSNTFTRWRYAYEAQEISAPYQFLFEFVGSLFEVHDEALINSQKN